ncbi:MAG: PAS domain-containing protein [Desulfobacterales bacterium]
MDRKNTLKVIGAVSVIALFGNLNALVDLAVHPEIPYFHKEHLIVGGITGTVMILLFFSLVFYIRHLDKARKKNAQLDKDRQRLIAEMKLTLAELESIYYSAPVGLCVFDNQLRFIRINQRMAELNGFEISEHIGCSPRDLLPNLADKADDLRNRVVESGKPIWGVEISGETPAQPGVERTWLESWLPLKDESGKVVRINVMAVEITDQKKLHQQLIEAHNQLEEKVRERTDQLAAAVNSLKEEIADRKEAQRRLRELSHKSIEALEAERKSISRELHDSIGSSLAAVKLSLEELFEKSPEWSEKNKNLCKKIIFNLINTIKETRRISANLRPHALDDYGLLGTIDWHIRQTKEIVRDIELIKKIDICEEQIPDRLKIIIYRIFQEALNNAAKHSRADKVTTLLTINGSALIFEIEDNGCGFDPQKLSKKAEAFCGFGILSIQERVEICGGSFSLQSQPGIGTRLRISFPINGESILRSQSEQLSLEEMESKSKSYQLTTQ